MRVPAPAFVRRRLANLAATLRRCLALAGLALLVAAPVPARAVTVEKVVSAGGIEAWLVRDPTIPILAVNFAFRGGASLDAADKLGLAQMVSGLLDEGAGDLDSETFQRKLNDLAIKLNFDAGLDEVTGSLKTLKENRDTAFELLRLALNAPRFDAEPVERVRNQLFTLLARNAEDANYIAAHTWFHAAFPDHPYGRPADGTPETVKAIGVDDLRAFVKQRLARDNLVIGVVGDITAQELAPLLDSTFGALPEHAAPDTVPEVKPTGAGALAVVARDIPQSVVVFGEAGIKRDEPDYYAAYVLNHILGGGGFSARLTREVREKRGLAYSVYSYLYPLDHAGLIMGGVATRNTRVKDSIALIRAEWQRLADHGVSAEELADAKSFLTGSFALRLDTSGKIADTLVSMQLNRLGIDYLDRRNALIEAVTPADENRIAKRLYDAVALSFVVVGEPEGVAAEKSPPATPPAGEPGAAKPAASEPGPGKEPPGKPM